MIEEFEGWVRKGLGRAVVFLRAHDAMPYREAILHACRYNLSYDRQCEESRGHYLVQLIEASRDEEFYREAVLASLSSDDSEIDLDQLFEVAESFVVKGDTEMKESMYAAFEKRGFAEAGVGCAEVLVQLDGEAALLFVARSFGEVDAEDRPWLFGYLMDAMGSRPLPSDMDHFYRESVTEKSSEPARPETTQNELIGGAEALLLETDPVRIVTYLRMFRFREFPGSPDFLVGLSRHNKDRVVRAAFVAMRNVCDLGIRDRAMELINDPKWRAWAVDLMVRNYREGDYRIIEGLLEKATDADEIHLMGLGVDTFVEANRSNRAEHALLFLYEKGPCSSCRYGFVKELMAIDRLPESIREECRFDAYSCTRELIEKGAG